ncbi:type II toxin-antitoxin system VapC family toxin [Paenibacillus sp. HB172176]|uniref:type II toxin-antitoxin system VapC family toxin n=1 Tax=Paenibacillus sp. HB172176 TaxID=2493690 RepID=UPI00143B4C28|nr:type II toxin-antitoxin system VapC family toxin [Paenibacillus sp. HB172176]
MNKVCLDANIWIKVLTEEQNSPQAEKLVIQLFRERQEIIAPSIMKVEVGSILRKKWSKKLLSNEDLQELWKKFESLPITYDEDRRIYERAWHIAEENRLIHLYDAVYLAICDHIPFWTADARLVRSVSTTTAQIQLLE